VNAVRFIDNSNSLIVSGSDDNLISVWDRRALNESQPKPVGIFAGHTNGITFLHSRVCLLNVKFKIYFFFHF
jgi:WD repeat-containing protein 23